MDQRRFIAFLLLTMAAWLAFNALFPPQRPPVKRAPAPDVKADAAAADRPLQADAEQQPAPQLAAAPPLPAVAAGDAPLKYVTLGSLDMASDYRMLVTLTSAGAAVHRAEMASDRFRDQHDWSGYLGDLELEDVPGGAQIRVVGAGTPAARATWDGKPAPLEAGDIIVGLGDSKTEPVKSADDFYRKLRATLPGRELVLQVRRGDDPPQSRVVQLGRRPFAVVRPEIDNYRMRDVAPPADFVDRPSLLTTIAALDNTPLKKDDAARLAALLETGNWELIASDQSSASFRRVLSELKLELIKRYTLAKAPASERENPAYPAYHLQLEIELNNVADVPRSLVYRLDGPTGMPLEGWWYAHKLSKRWFAAAGLRDVVVRFAGGQEQQLDCPTIVEGKVSPMGEGRALAYAGVDGQYFSAVLLPDIKTLDDVWFDTTEAVLVGNKPDPRTPPTFANVTCRLSRKSIDLAAGANHRDSYRVFLGPKRPELLAQYYAANDQTYSLKDLLYFGWPIFAAVAHIMLWFLHVFYGIVGNYGIAIILLTVLVRGAMFPISFKQTQNMVRMQEKLKAIKADPEFSRINERYKNDMQKRSQATQELYRKYGVNPMDQLTGCLPVFLQLPVFIGLYRALSVDVELRQSPLFGESIRWVSNLAAPDMLWNWSAIMPDFITSGQGLFGLGPYLNVLPLVTVALFLVTQKMAMSPPTNEQEVMQQKMMKYMTVFMGFFFYKVASGLCLYFIVSSLWGIAERKLLRKTQSADTSAGGSSTDSKGKGPNNGGSRPSSNGSPGVQRRPEKSKRKK